MGIGIILSELIEQKKSNVNEIAKIANVSPQTLYSMIKRDSMKVDIEVLIKVSNALGVNVEYFYNKYVAAKLSPEPNKFLTTDEQKLIKKYRTLDERGKKAVDDTLQREYEFANKVINKHSATLITAEKG